MLGSPKGLQRLSVLDSDSTGPDLSSPGHQGIFKLPRWLQRAAERGRWLYPPLDSSLCLAEHSTLWGLHPVFKFVFSDCSFVCTQPDVIWKALSLSLSPFPCQKLWTIQTICDAPSHPVAFWMHPLALPLLRPTSEALAQPWTFTPAVPLSGKFSPSHFKAHSLLPAGFESYISFPTTFFLVFNFQPSPPLLDAFILYRLSLLYFSSHRLTI